MLKKGLENNYEDSDRCKHSKPAIDIFKVVQYNRNYFKFQ